MTHTPSRTKIAAFALLVLTSFGFPGSVRAQFPAAPIDDTTTSLGSFTIQVAPAFQSLVQALVSSGELPTSGSPGGSGFYWQASGPGGYGYLTSPLLYDATTTIGLSAEFAAPAPGSGVTVGVTNSQTITPSDYSVLPTSPGWPAAAGTFSIYTQMESMNLQPLYFGGAFASVTAGVGQGDPLSPGQVIASTPSGDFPAQSFFDIFANITVGTTTMGSFTFANTTPLLVESSGLQSLPPTVLYTHDNTSSVPIYFTSGLFAGEEFGVIQLAGHGAGYSDKDPSDGTTGAPGPTAFTQQYETMMQADGLSTPEPSTLTLALIAGTALAGCGWYRRRQQES